MAEVTDLFSVEFDIETTKTNPVRLGPKKDNMQWLRPLPITMDNEAIKWKIRKKSKYRNNSGEEMIKKVFKNKHDQMEYLGRWYVSL